MWRLLFQAGEKVTITTKYVVSNAEIFILVWLLLLLFFIYNEIWKSEHKKCYMCGKWILKNKMYWQRFADSPKDFEAGGYKALVCEPCAEECEQWTRP